MLYEQDIEYPETYALKNTILKEPGLAVNL